MAEQKVKSKTGSAMNSKDGKSKKEPKKRMNIIFKGLICLVAVLICLAATPFASETANTFLIAQQKASAKQTAAAAKKAASQTAVKDTASKSDKTSSSQTSKASETSSASSKAEKKVNTLVTMKPLLQGNLSSGCELTALATVLNFYNEKVDTDTLSLFLDSDDTSTVKDGKTYRANPWNTFVGSPDKNYYGCFAPVIAQTAHDFFNAVGSARQAKAMKDTPPSKLYEYISKNIPVIVWVTTDMQPVNFSEQWYDKDTSQLIKWPGNEHCVVLIDYNDKEVTVCDPQKGTVKYNRTAFEKSYKELSQQAVEIH